ncbi:MAG TPA: PAS domain-containing protein, partial [Acidimicrobiales bacterium]|nr:PAS domain-containing protein [Acidimicrobiales bacterium]
MTPAPNHRRVAVLTVAAVVVGLLVSSWVITSVLRDRAARASARVEDVAAAVASLSRLQSAENHFFNTITPAPTVDFSTLIARVLVAAHRIGDPGANRLLASYLSQADRVVVQIENGNVGPAATIEGQDQVPAGDLLINAYDTFASRQAALATSTEATAADLTQAVQWGSLLLLVLALLTFWWLDARTERERSRAVERTEARYRGIVARGSDALFLLDAAGAVTFASESTRAVLGHDVDDALAPTFASLFPEDERLRLEEALAEARADPGHPATVPITLDEPDKRFLEVVVNDRLDDPSIAAVVVSARDLT